MKLDLSLIVWCFNQIEKSFILIQARAFCLGELDSVSVFLGLV
jgi:hypothetical protein